MFVLSKNEMQDLKQQLTSAAFKETDHRVYKVKGCPNCNGQCKNGCGVTCTAIFS